MTDCALPRVGSLSSQNLILKGHAFRIVFLEPSFRGVGICEDLEVIGVSDRLARK
jgi:hypothetical protein